MSKLLALAMLCVVALLPLEAQAHAMPYGTHVTRWHHLTTALDGSVVDRAGWVYSFPVKVKAKPAVHLHKRAVVRHPKRVVHRRPPSRVNRPRGRYVQSWLVTYYTDVGPMADGVYTYWGAASCGYDVALGTRISVAGVAGVLTCHDRMCTTCPGVPFVRHVDIWGYRPGLGHDWRNVTIY